MPEKKTNPKTLERLKSIGKREGIALRKKKCENLIRSRGSCVQLVISISFAGLTQRLRVPLIKRENKKELKFWLIRDLMNFFPPQEATICPQRPFLAASSCLQMKVFTKVHGTDPRTASVLELQRVCLVI